jgi:hypothetical protein
MERATAVFYFRGLISNRANVRDFRCGPYELRHPPNSLTDLISPDTIPTIGPNQEESRGSSSLTQNTDDRS